jgi:hypothetical protein
MTIIPEIQYQKPNSAPNEIADKSKSDKLINVGY